MEKLSGLSHLFMTIFLHNFANFMVIPAITDVTMEALCPGKDECSLAIFISGFQQAIIGLGSFLMMPFVGNLSDKYGRKALLTLPITLTIIPLAILAYSRTKSFFYAYYVFKILTAMFCEGSVHCLALAYVADNVPEGRRASAFGILSGIGSCAFVCGTLFTRFLSTASIFQVATAMAMLSAVYMTVFLTDSVINDNLSTPIISKENFNGIVNQDEESNKKIQTFKTMPSIEDMLALLKNSLTFSQAAIVSFFSNLADVGLHASLLVHLQSHMNHQKTFDSPRKINTRGRNFDSLLLMPVLAPALGEERLLSIGLFFSCAHMLFYSIAWSLWVPYAAAVLSLFYVFSQPCIRSIVSKQVGSSEQGKAQGFISGIGSFAQVASPLVFSPLTGQPKLDSYHVRRVCLDDSFCPESHDKSRSSYINPKSRQQQLNRSRARNVYSKP
ncbi:Major facilitator superfamily protein isoform 2 [Hibiscus syriacus]|uniref:Major facilitator superfamily protein isoform 2 n=1 Tax=Hibiscus syriacus TaxID=106335 RepID=A0A6A2WK08_HIBSY|nr:Major facilitator superfamily protein isoform 2 [Hibiscus syriacus]